MSKIYLSFLGTSNYLACNYTMPGKTKISNVRFVQEATIAQECRNWSNDDHIIIFTTEQAQQKNWLDNGQTGAEPSDSATTEGLYSRLQQLGLQAQIKQVSIPSGKSEAEIWQIFDIFYQQLEENSEIILDITHAFRSIPMLALVIINYTKILKNITVNGIFYGAMEAVGSPYEVKELPLEERNIPVFELTAFDSLLDWSVAIDRFITTGNTERLVTLSHQATKPVFINQEKNDRAERQTAGQIKRMISRLKELTDSLATCRATDIETQAENLKQNFISIDQTHLIKPLGPMLNQLNATADRFVQNNSVKTGIESAKWCAEHNLIQQAYTILQETCITAFVLLSSGEILDREKREIITQATSVVNQKREWTKSMQQNKLFSERLIENLKKYQNISLLIEQLSGNRNDINHAGYRNGPLESKDLKKKLEQYLKEAEQWVTEVYS